MAQIKAVILCGGSGTRLWPLSVPSRPKQFQRLTSNQSMLAETASRLQSRTGKLHFEQPLIVGSARHVRLIRESVPNADMILEPFGRDSAPAIAAAALASDPEALLLILPADHHIKDLHAFEDAIATGVRLAEDGKFVTFGIQPTEPATGYGYIKGTQSDGAAQAVERFVEKPDRATAESYLAEGCYYWNAGIFLFKARSFIEYTERKNADIVTAVKAALGSAREQVMSLEADAFQRSPSISVDYAVMEPASLAGDVAVVPVDMGWSDVGDHASVYHVTGGGNGAVSVSGPSIAQDGERLSLSSTGPLLATVGVNNIAVVASSSAVLVADLDRTQDVKDIAKAANGFSYGFLLPAETKTKIKHWLIDVAFARWAEHAWSPQWGGFKETLSFEDFSEQGEMRRLRVQMRQIYAFAHAKVLGWDGPAHELVTKGIDYLDTTYWNKDRGYVHRFSPSGSVIDDRMDTYDHAFALIAFAWSYRAGFLPDAKSRIDKIITLIEDRLSLPGGGYRDDDTGESGLRSNPHMHMLEAYLALFEAFGDDQWLRRAGDVVTLFEARFFDPTYDCILEHFDPNWALDPVKGDRTEPGHMYEWASLLAKYEMYSGHDTLSWRRRLIARADQTGRSPKTGFAYNVVSRSGSVIDASRRLWPQTEMFRAKIVEPGANGIEDAHAIVDRLFATYLADAPEGFLMDSYGADGQPSAKSIPGSMLYHMITAFAPVINGSAA